MLHISHSQMNTWLIWPERPTHSWLCSALRYNTDSTNGRLMGWKKVSAAPKKKRKFRALNCTQRKSTISRCIWAGWRAAWWDLILGWKYAQLQAVARTPAQKCEPMWPHYSSCSVPCLFSDNSRCRAEHQDIHTLHMKALCICAFHKNKGRS